jgi:hypothetical protein
MRAGFFGEHLEAEACHLEGVAARWQSSTRSHLHARTGISAAAIGEALGVQGGRVVMPITRPLPTPELDAPREWLQWAREVAGRTARRLGCVRYVSRRAAVVRGDGWRTISSPALVRVEVGGDRAGALLAVWRHPRTGDWLRSLLQAVPQKRWSPEPGTSLPVLFRDGTAGALLHEVVGHMAEADVVIAGSSPLASLMGASISAPSLHVTDDPTRFDLAGGFDHDDEGEPACPIPLVRAGRFESFLCDTAGAADLDARAGRARRSGWSHQPVARLSNLVVAAGDTDPDELEKELDHGLVVTQVGGATVDPLASRLVLRVERGWEVRNGRRRRALAPCELTGQVMDVLARIDARIGDDPTPDWRLGWCVKDGLPLPTGSEAPSLLVGGLEVL